jgi:hypothetical protein
LKSNNTIIFYCCAAIALILFANRLLLLFSYNLDLGGLENYFAFLTLKVGSGEMYSHPEHYPFMVTQYPPLYLHLAHYTAEVLNIYYQDMVRSVYVGGRILNLIFNICTVAIIFSFFKRHLHFETKIAALPALIIFTLFIEHAYAVRMDSLKMLLVTALYIQGYHYFKESNNRQLAILICIGFLAMVAKQDAAIHVGVLGLVFFSQKQFLKAFMFGLPIAVLFFVFAWLICERSIEVFLLNFIVGIAQGIDFIWAKMVFDWNPFAMVAQLVMVLTVLVWGLKNRRNEWYMPILLLFLYVFASFNILKWGSNFNYYFEFQILIVCLFVYWMQKNQSKLLASIFFICMATFLFNNIWNKNLGLISVKEEKAWKQEYFKEKEVASGLSALLAKEGASKVIVFSRALSLMLYNQVVLGTTANEYPEWQFPYVKSLPRRTYDYHLDCKSEYINQVRFITWDEVDLFHQKLVREMFDTNKDLALTTTQKYGIYNFYQLSCVE